MKIGYDIVSKADRSQTSGLEEERMGRSEEKLKLDKAVDAVEFSYFMLDDDGTVQHLSEEELTQNPTKKKIVALLNTSMWIPGRKETPNVIRNVITRALNLEIEDKNGVLRKPNICLALPKEPIDKMRAYYGLETNDNRVPDHFVALRIHDDLRQCNDNYINHGMRVEGTLPAETGAAFIIKSIKKGFPIWPYSGGNSIHPKLQLAERYFAEEEISLEDNKSYFIGFSNISTSQFYLRGQITPIHYYGLIWSILGGDKEMNSLIIRTLEGENDLTHTRVMASENISDIQHRVETMVKEGDIIRNVTFFPHALGITCDSTFPKFKENEKIILGLEGYSQMPTGYNVHEVLFKAIDSGALDPDKILFISIEDIIQQIEQFDIPRRNGFIPNFENLSAIKPSANEKSEQEHIIAIATKRGFYQVEAVADSDNPTLEEATRIKEAEAAAAQAYINASNDITRNEIARIKEIAAKFNIPVVDGGVRRAGHAKQPMIQPSKIVMPLQFGSDGKIIQTSILSREKQEYLISDVKKDPNHPAPIWPELEQKSIFESEEHQFIVPKYEYNKGSCSIVDYKTGNEELAKAGLLPLNKLAELTLIQGGEENVIMGNALNIMDLPIDQIRNKGLVFHLPLRETITPSHESHQIITSNQFHAAKFVIFSLEIPEGIATEKYEEYLTNRNKVFEKLIEDYNIKKPVLITTTSIQHENLPTLFVSSLNIHRAPLPRPESKQEHQVDNSIPLAESNSTGMRK